MLCAGVNAYIRHPAHFSVIAGRLNLVSARAGRSGPTPVQDFSRSLLVFSPFLDVRHPISRFD
jgi:hypothetical protein